MASCFLQSLFNLNALTHDLQEKGLLEEWTIRWAFWWLLCVDPFPQIFDVHVFEYSSARKYGNGVDRLLPVEPIETAGTFWFSSGCSFDSLVLVKPSRPQASVANTWHCE